MITAFLVAFGTVFLAELPDKTMVASLVLTTKFRRTRMSPDRPTSPSAESP